MKHRIALLALGGLLAAPLAQALDCKGAPEVAIEKVDARVIVVGEVHGTAEAPGFIARLTCSLLRQHRPVIVALERDGAEQDALNRYLQSPGHPADVKALLASGAWAKPQFQDGRNSQAMLQLIEQLRGWRQAGERVGVMALQLEFHEIAPLTQAEQRPLAQAEQDRFSEINDRVMADKAWAAMALHSGYTVVALAGNVHTALGSKSRARFEPAPSFADVLAGHTAIHVIGLSSQGGTSWNSTSQGMGPRSVMRGPMFLRDARIDTQVDLGPISASPPAASP